MILQFESQRLDVYLHIKDKEKGTKGEAEGWREGGRKREREKHFALLNSMDAKKEYLF